MKYVERSLTEGERIVYTTRRHWVVLVGPGVFAAVLAAAGIALLFQKDFFWIGGVLLLAIAAGIFISALVRRYGFEFAVTNKRVIYCARPSRWMPPMFRLGLCRRRSTPN